jgi:hypothetical protein
MRPSKLTPQTTETICEALGSGAYLETASRAAGVAPSTLHGWLQRGRLAEQSSNPKSDDLPFLELLEAVKKAQAVAEMTALSVIREAAERGTWQAAAWFLERSNPAAWGRDRRANNPGSHDSGGVAGNGSDHDAKAALMTKLDIIEKRHSADAYMAIGIGGT